MEQRLVVTLGGYASNLLLDPSLLINPKAFDVVVDTLSTRPIDTRFFAPSSFLEGLDYPRSQVVITRYFYAGRRRPPIAGLRSRIEDLGGKDVRALPTLA